MAQPGLILVWSKGEPVRKSIEIPWSKHFQIGRELVPGDDRTSAKHATIYARAGLDPEFVLTNTESRNGTFVDGTDIGQNGYAWEGSVLRTGSSLWIATTDLSRYENPDEFSRLNYGAIIRDTARAKTDKPVHYSAVKRCLRSEFRDRAELVAAIEYAIARADDRIGEEHLPKLRPLQPTVPFAKHFELVMSAPPPFEIPAKYHVHSIHRGKGGVPHETIIGSDAQRPDLMSIQLGDTLAKQPGYFMAGFWGHGVNSYSVYLARTTERSRLFLRLPYGAGAYSAPGERERALERLERFWFLAETLPVVHVTLLDALGTAYYELVCPDGRVITSPEGLYSLDEIDFLELAIV